MRARCACTARCASLTNSWLYLRGRTEARDGAACARLAKAQPDRPSVPFADRAREARERAGVAVRGACVIRLAACRVASAARCGCGAGASGTWSAFYAGGRAIKRTRGTDNRSKGTDNRNKGTDIRNKGTDIRNKGTDNRSKGIDNRNKGIDNRTTLQALGGL